MVTGHFRGFLGALAASVEPGDDLPRMCASTAVQHRVVERTYLAADTAGIAKPPTEPPKPTSWDIYKAASKAIWVGSVEAPDKAAAIEKAAADFKQDAWRLIAVERR
jgi:hypothetical protein